MFKITRANQSDVPVTHPRGGSTESPQITGIIDLFEEAQQIRHLGGFSCAGNPRSYQLYAQVPPMPPDAGVPVAAVPTPADAGPAKTPSQPAPVAPATTPNQDATNVTPAPAPEPTKILPAPVPPSAPVVPVKTELKPAPVLPVIAKKPDTDGDGVPDNQDKCPSTPNNHPDIKITTSGCLNSWDLPEITKMDIKQSGPGYRKRGWSKPGGTFDGTYKVKVIVPNLEKAIALFTGEDTASFAKLPNMMEPAYQKNGDGIGTLTYFIKGQIMRIPRPFMDPIIIEIGRLGYRINATVDRSQIARGIVTVSWKNTEKQPAKRPSDSADVSYFDKNIGYWKLTQIDGYDPPLYEMEWHAETDINDNSLPTGATFVPEGTIIKNSWHDTRAIVQKAAYILRDFK